MALPKSYLTSTKNLGAILEAIQQAKAPERFTVRFLESLDFKGTADRLVLGVLKSLGFLDDQGRPTSRYFSFLDQTQSAAILADAVREAYSDLFAVNINAHTLTKTELINKFKTLSQGAYSESVLEKMAITFQSLAKIADFTTSSTKNSRANLEDNAQGDLDENPENAIENDGEELLARSKAPRNPNGRIQSLGGLHYNIQIILPESRDPQVYDLLFRSLKEHLL